MVNWNAEIILNFSKGSTVQVVVASRWKQKIAKHIVYFLHSVVLFVNPGYQKLLPKSNPQAKIKNTIYSHLSLSTIHPFILTTHSLKTFLRPGFISYLCCKQIKQSLTIKHLQWKRFYYSHWLLELWLSALISAAARNPRYLKAPKFRYMAVKRGPGFN